MRNCTRCLGSGRAHPNYCERKIWSGFETGGSDCLKMEM
jgi:hypothetical protein